MRSRKLIKSNGEFKWYTGEEINRLSPYNAQQIIVEIIFIFKPNIYCKLKKKG
jgi:hypothetical protein